MSLPEKRGSLALLAELERNGAISVIGLHLSEPNLTYGKFEALCALLGKMNQAVKFAIGDAIILGEQLYGEKAYQAFEALELSEAGMAEYVRVAQRVPRSIRRKDLSWSHHRCVAAMTTKIEGVNVPDTRKQKEWLKRASDQGWNHEQFRDALRATTEPSETTSCRCCGRPL